MRLRSHVAWYASSAVVQLIVPLVTLPLVTRILGPADFGLFAVIVGFANLTVAVASLGVSYHVASHYRGLDLDEQTAFVSTVLVVTLLLAAAMSVLTIAGWRVAAHWGAIPRMRLNHLVLASAGAFLNIPWAVASEIAVIGRRSQIFALLTAAQTLASAGVTVFALFVLSAGVDALFLGYVASSVVALGAAGVILHRQVRPRWSRRWLGELWRLGPLASAGALGEAVYAAFERAILMMHASLSGLGLYTHSQQYRNMMFAAVKAVTRAVFPVSLEESDDPKLRYQATRRAWRLVHIGLTTVGVSFALAGAPVISRLTNDKFTAAAPLAALWMAYLLVKHSGRPELAYLYHSRQARSLAGFGLACSVIGIASLGVLVPIWGVYGAFTAATLQEVIYRLAIGLKVRKTAQVPFSDGVALAGATLVLALVIAQPQVVHSLSTALLVFAVLPIIAIGTLSLASLRRAA